MPVTWPSLTSGTMTPVRPSWSPRNTVTSLFSAARCLVPRRALSVAVRDVYADRHAAPVDHRDRGAVKAAAPARQTLGTSHPVAGVPEHLLDGRPQSGQRAQGPVTQGLDRRPRGQGLGHQRAPARGAPRSWRCRP